MHVIKEAKKLGTYRTPAVPCIYIWGTEGGSIIMYINPSK